MSRRPLAISHDKVKDFGWEPTYVRRRPLHPTRYRIPTRTKDPFRHLLREYLAMEEEKDNRQYGALEDVVARTSGPQRAQPRWMEVLKPLLAVTNYAEYAAAKAMATLVDTVENPELRQGYLAQMLDEVRHVNAQGYLIRYLSRHASDPAGFNCALAARATDPITRAGRVALFDSFLNDDPITCVLMLQVIAEAGYTNAVFVAGTEIAAANDDPATPSVFLSIQSDEARHMANGYATLAAVLSEPDNLTMLQHDFDNTFWRFHAFIDPFLGVVYDYFPHTRLDSYQAYWQRWIWEDWFGSYIERLAPFGLSVPRWAERARSDVRWSGHTLAMLTAALWPLHFWRTDPMGEADYEYFEDHYPGWWSRYGRFWETYRELADPAHHTLALEAVGSIPPLCRVCHMPANLPHPETSDARVVMDNDGRKHALCSPPCTEIFTEAPYRYGARTWWELFDGMDLAEYVERCGLLRADGRTLIAQPHLRTDESSLWTIDDLRRLAVEIRDPLRDLPVSAENAVR